MEGIEEFKADGDRARDARPWQDNNGGAVRGASAIRRRADLAAAGADRGVDPGASADARGRWLKARGDDKRRG